MAARTWNCKTCGKQVLPVRDAAGVIVCPRCRKAATPTANPAQPRPHPASSPSKPGGLRPPAAQSDARRPARPSSSSSSSLSSSPSTTSSRRSIPASTRPATPDEALAQSSAWVPESDPGPSPDAIGLSGAAPASWGREQAYAGGRRRAGEVGARWTRSPIALVGAGAGVIALAVVVAVLVQQGPGRSASPTQAIGSGSSSSGGSSGGRVKIAVTSPPVNPQQAINTQPAAPVNAREAVASAADTVSPSVSSTAGANFAATVGGAPSTPGRTMNLLALLDLSRDVIGGEWREVPGGITSDDAKYARLALPYQPPAEYDFKVEFTRTSSKEESVVQLFILHGHSCAWVMNGWQGSICAFSMINGRVGKDNGTGTHDVPLHAGERHVSIVKVRKDAIEAYLDGKLLNRHPTDGTDLSLVRDWDLRGRPLGIGSFQNAVVFHAIEILEITGKGRLLIEPAGAGATTGAGATSSVQQDDPVR